MTKLNSLQILRAFAAISVVVTHVFQKLGYKPFGDYYISGQYGVDIFFILSGFLIYLTIKSNTKIVTYLKKRLFRIYPLYLCALLPYLIVKIKIFDLYLTPKVLIQNIMMLPWDRPIGYDSLIIGVAWSTVFEMFFYFLFFLLLLTKFNKKGMIYVIPMLFVAGKLLTKLKILDENIPFISLLVSLISSKNMFMFWIGCVISEIYSNYNFPQIKKKVYVCLLIGVGLLFCIAQLLPYNFYMSFLVSASLFTVVSQFEKYFRLDQRKSIINGLIYLGDISYSIYIFHILIINICMYYFGVRDLIVVLISTLGFTIALSIFTYKYIEKPFINLSKK